MPRIALLCDTSFGRGAIIGIFMGFLALICFTVPCFAQAFPTRLVVHLVLVPSADQSSDFGLRSWSRLFSLRLSNITYDPTFGLKNGDRVIVRSTDNAAIPSVSEMSRIWQQANAIEVIDAISFKDGADTVIEYNVYFGELKGYLETPLLPIKQTVRVNDYVVTRDLITLTFLYALAVDARGHTPIACALLDRSRLIARDVKLSEIGLKALDDAIQQSLRDEKCAPTR